MIPRRLGVFPLVISVSLADFPIDAPSGQHLTPMGHGRVIAEQSLLSAHVSETRHDRYTSFARDRDEV